MMQPYLRVALFCLFYAIKTQASDSIILAKPGQLVSVHCPPDGNALANPQWLVNDLPWQQTPNVVTKFFSFGQVGLLVYSDLSTSANNTSILCNVTATAAESPSQYRFLIYVENPPSVEDVNVTFLDGFYCATWSESVSVDNNISYCLTMQNTPICGIIRSNYSIPGSACCVASGNCVLRIGARNKFGIGMETNISMPFELGESRIENVSKNTTLTGLGVILTVAPAICDASIRILNADTGEMIEISTPEEIIIVTDSIHSSTVQFSITTNDDYHYEIIAKLTNGAGTSMANKTLKSITMERLLPVKNATQTKNNHKFNYLEVIVAPLLLTVLGIGVFVVAVTIWVCKQSQKKYKVTEPERQQSDIAVDISTEPREVPTEPPHETASELTGAEQSDIAVEIPREVLPLHETASELTGAEQSDIAVEIPREVMPLHETAPELTGAEQSNIAAAWLTETSREVHAEPPHETAELLEREVHVELPTSELTVESRRAEITAEVHVASELNVAEQKGHLTETSAKQTDNLGEPYRTSDAAFEAVDYEETMDECAVEGQSMISHSYGSVHKFVRRRYRSSSGREYCDGEGMEMAASLNESLSSFLNQESGADPESNLEFMCLHPQSSPTDSPPNSPTV